MSMVTPIKVFTVTVENYMSINSFCINEVKIHGEADKIKEILKYFNQAKNDNQFLYDLDPSENPRAFLEVTHSNETLIDLNFFSKTPVNILLKKLSEMFQVKIESIYYNPEDDYAGKAIYYEGAGESEIDSYYKGLYFNYQNKFWEEIDNLIHRMGLSGADWSEIENEIKFVSEEDYNEIKEHFKQRVCITTTGNLYTNKKKS